LGETTAQVNNIKVGGALEWDVHTMPHKMIHHESHQDGGHLPYDENHAAASNLSPVQDRHDRHSGAVPDKRLSAVSKEEYDRRRESQISTTSTTSSRSRKSHIGPWHLGKTLGRGATARVRMARHHYTGQLAAVKIVQKKNAQLSQAGSLAALDKQDQEFKPTDGVRRMPYGVEREVAIMKLIEHPHIMKIYDIWENHAEM
jgi:hypothetical protein